VRQTLSSALELLFWLPFSACSYVQCLGSTIDGQQGFDSQQDQMFIFRTSDECLALCFRNQDVQVSDLGSDTKPAYVIPSHMFMDPTLN
jgi:hypothetical protein